MELLILAKTKFHSGYCIAGVNEKLKWGRPVACTNEKKPLMRSQIQMDNNKFIKKYNIVKYNRAKKLKNNPHSEDFLFDTRTSPRYLYDIGAEDILEIFKKIDESKILKDDIKDYLIKHKKSLMLVKPDKILNYKEKKTDHGIQNRIIFELNKKSYNYPITDLHYNSVVRKESNDVVIKKIKNRDNYLAIGLTREYRDKYWPLIIGVHTIPKLKG